MGKELDKCDRMDFQLPKDLVEVFKNPQLDWYTPLTQYLSKKNSRLGDCGYGGSEELGNIVKFYNPPGSSYEPIGYGAGSHTNVVSDKGDYTLRYTIIRLHLHLHLRKRYTSIRCQTSLSRIIPLLSTK